ncbi:MAG: P-loop NTPase [Anaerolineales bacterium]|nr:P-loop NTPase [Anaerolineales bacterium]
MEGFSPTARDHAENPRHHGRLKEFHGHARVTGPCGDTMEYWLSVRHEKIHDISFVTDGCGSSRACGSLAACLAEGKRVEDAAAVQQRDILAALGAFPDESKHCALLAANSLKAACEDYLSRRDQSIGAAPRENDCKGESGGESQSVAAMRLEGESEKDFIERRALHDRLSRIQRKIIVLSGKGGVGKSTIAVNLAVELARTGYRTGLLDVDLHGPSIPTLLGMEKETIRGGAGGMLPAEVDGLKVMSIGFLLDNPDDAVIWRGPAKMGAIRQFFQDVAWGDLDYLIIDSPPGTGDEPLSVCQLAGRLDGAVIVTTPQKVAAVDVRKSITFCRQLRIPVIGVVENMSGFACPKCGEVTQILPSGGGRRIAEDMSVPFLGAIPMDPKIAEACDNGHAFLRQYAPSPTAMIMREIIRPVLELRRENGDKHELKTTSSKENTPMRFAIPLADGKLTMHFGHCASFALVDADCSEKKILKREDIDAPPHEPGLLPQWLAEHGVQVIIAGGMGSRAQNLFQQQNIRVIVGAPADTPERLVAVYLDGSLQSGENVCDH